VLSLANSLPTFPLDTWIDLSWRAGSNIWRPPFVRRKNNPRWPPREQLRRLPYPLRTRRRQHYWRRRRARPSRTPPPKRPSKMTLSTTRDSARTIPPPTALYAHAVPRVHHKHRHQASLRQRAIEAKRQRVTMQVKVRQMIQDEEQRARELEQEIAFIQGEGQYNLQRGPLAPPAPLQQYIQAGDPFQPQCDSFIPPAAAF
jgi:hypothetical protein